MFHKVSLREIWSHEGTTQEHISKAQFLNSKNLLKYQDWRIVEDPYFIEAMTTTSSLSQGLHKMFTREVDIFNEIYLMDELQGYFWNSFTLAICGEDMDIVKYCEDGSEHITTMPKGQWYFTGVCLRTIRYNYFIYDNADEVTFVLITSNTGDGNKVIRIGHYPNRKCHFSMALVGNHLYVYETVVVVIDITINIEVARFSFNDSVGVIIVSNDNLTIALIVEYDNIVYIMRDLQIIKTFEYTKYKSFHKNYHPRSIVGGVLKDNKLCFTTCQKTLVIFDILSGTLIKRLVYNNYLSVALYENLLVLSDRQSIRLIDLDTFKTIKYKVLAKHKQSHVIDDRLHIHDLINKKMNILSIPQLILIDSFSIPGDERLNINMF
jgi:hypothetical protein